MIQEIYSQRRNKSFAGVVNKLIITKVERLQGYICSLGLALQTAVYETEKILSVYSRVHKAIFSNL